MPNKFFIFCLVFSTLSKAAFTQNDFNEATLEELSEELALAHQQVKILVSELEKRIVSDTLTQADLTVVVNSLLELESPIGYNLILKHNKRYTRGPKSASELAYLYVTENPKPFYSIHEIFGKWVERKHLIKFQEYLYGSVYFHKPIPEEDLAFIRFFLRDYTTDEEKDFQKVRAENLRRIKEQN